MMSSGFWLVLVAFSTVPVGCSVLVYVLVRSSGSWKILVGLCGFNCVMQFYWVCFGKLFCFWCVSRLSSRL